MCLKDIAFSMEEVDGVLVGIGYKAFKCYISGDLKLGYDGCKYKLNQWMKAKNDIHSVTRTEDKNLYSTGFHIFLNKDDANRYYERPSYNPIIIKKVLFKDIVAFGTNRTYTRLRNGRVVYRPCVIARSMKILPESIK